MRKALNILVAEDCADDLFLLEIAFQKAGVSGRLHSVTNGAETVDYLKGKGAYGDRAVYPFPDILLLDLNMPRLNGFEVLDWVRQDSDCKRLVVYVLSASARESDVDRAYDLGANGYLVKPSGSHELVALVRALDQWHDFARLPRARVCAEEEPASYMRLKS